ncbi:MAG: cation transporter [Clostridiales bacterium]|nr:cation transporter [Clostridiales bacterium]
MVDIYKKVRKVLWIILIANLLVAFLKFSLGLIMKSNSMTADAVHSFTDGASNIVGLIGIYFASKPVDNEHPYGHKKYEMVAGMFISVMLLLVGLKVIAEGVTRLIYPVEPNITLPYILILLFTIVINIIVSAYENKKGQKLNSQILISDSVHTKSDILVSFGVLATLLCIKLGLPPIIDSIVSYVIAGFIFHSAYEIFKDNSSILIDTAIVDTEQIRQIAKSFDSIKDIHKVRSRGAKNDIYIDMHVMTEPDLSVEKSHELVHQLELKIKKEINQNVQVIVHLEPYEKI